MKTNTQLILTECDFVWTAVGAQYMKSNRDNEISTLSSNDKN